METIQTKPNKPFRLLRVNTNQTKKILRQTKPNQTKFKQNIHLGHWMLSQPNQINHLGYWSPSNQNQTRSNQTKHLGHWKPSIGGRQNQTQGGG